MSGAYPLEALLAILAGAMNRENSMNTIYVVSHTHWDREWYRTFQQFRLKLVHLVDGLLALLEQDPGYQHFMLDGQTIVLDDYLQVRPEKEALLRKYVQEGRILIGPWRILPDMFLVGPEAHIRNLLEGDRTARRFGEKMMVGYIPDPFGHPGQTPQLLRGFDLETACLWRGADLTHAEFWWQAPDGSRVLMAYLRDGYGNGADLPADDPPRFASQLAERADGLRADAATPHLLVMYGTDHMEPPANTAAAIAYADAALPNAHVIHSTLPQYVAAVKQALGDGQITLPVVTGELRACRRMHLLPGVLSARMWIKQRNRVCEVLLEKWAEPFAAFQELIALQPPQAALLARKPDLVRHAWRLLMENHPHDSICGCSIDQVHEEMKVRFDQVDQLGEELTRQSLEGIAGSIQTDCKLRDADQPAAALVVFNPLAGPRTDVVTAAIAAPGLAGFDIVDEHGVALPYQEEGLGTREVIRMTLDSAAIKAGFGNISGGRVAGMTVQEIRSHREGAEVFIEAVVAQGGEPNLSAWNAERRRLDEYLADPTVAAYHVRACSTSARLIMIAPDVPGHGYRTFWIRPRDTSPPPPARLSPLASALLPLGRLPVVQRFAGRRRYARPPYKIENDLFAVEAQADGTLTLQDKRDGQVYTGLNQLRDGGDGGDEYNYAPPERDAAIVPRLRRVAIATGPLQQTLELELTLVAPVALAPDRKARAAERVALPIKTAVTLSRGVPRVEIHTCVENRARDHRLRVHFPAPFSVAKAQHDGHFEVIERGLGVPAHDETWVEQPRPEVPQRVFTSVTDGRARLTVAVRGLPEVEALKNAAGNTEIAVTLLRCVGWLSRDDFVTRQGHAGPPAVATPGAQMPGRWEFDYAIIPGLDALAAYREAYAFETPMRGVSASLHAGPLPSCGSFIAATPAAFAISALKQAEDGNGWLVRGYNVTGDEIQVTLQPWRPFAQVARANLAETPFAPLAADEGGRVTLRARGHEIVSVLFRE